MFLLYGLIFLALVVFFSTLFTIKQQTSGIIERFGKFARVVYPGLNIKIPFIERLAGLINLRVQQLDVRVETKTKDNVFVHIVVSVQYFVMPSKASEAFYKLTDAEKQMSSFVFDVVRARVPNINLDDAFERKDDIADAVKAELTANMTEFGYAILKALVTEIDPDQTVKIAMNEINAAQRNRLAATEKGEAERILKVKAAEAEAQSKALQGKGIADQRKAIVEGLQESVDTFQKSVPGTSAQDVMNLVLMTQYFDTLKEISMTGKTNTILIPHSPSGMEEIASQIRNAIITGEHAARSSSHE